MLLYGYLFDHIWYYLAIQLTIYGIIWFITSYVTGEPSVPTISGVSDPLIDGNEYTATCSISSPDQFSYGNITLLYGGVIKATIQQATNIASVIFKFMAKYEEHRGSNFTCVVANNVGTKTTTTGPLTIYGIIWIFN